MIMVPHSKPKKPSNQKEKLPPKHPNVVKNKPSPILQLDGVGISTLILLTTISLLIDSVNSIDLLPLST